MSQADTVKTGRPSLFTTELADDICTRIAAGTSLRAICRAEGMPTEATVRGWALDDLQGFGDKYRRAQEVRAHELFDQILEIADDATADITIGDDGVPVTNREVVARSRLRVDSRKWFLSKVLPKVYGDRIAVETKVEPTPLSEHLKRAQEILAEEWKRDVEAEVTRRMAGLPARSFDGDPA